MLSPCSSFLYSPEQIERVRALVAARDPALLDAVADVDRTLIRAWLDRDCWERVRFDRRERRVDRGATFVAQDRLNQLLGALLDAHIEFVVIGGLAGVLHGAPVTTADIDIVHNKSEQNVDRLLSVLATIHARMRADPRNIAPARTHLQGNGHVLLETDFGRSTSCVSSALDRTTTG